MLLSIELDINFKIVRQVYLFFFLYLIKNSISLNKKKSRKT